MYPKIRQVLHKLAMSHDSLNRRGDCRLYIWAKSREDEVCEFRDTWTDEDETHEKACERNPAEEP
jgi:hypothetical protein